MSDALYSWFWQPPLEGQPGLIMFVDRHPGPDRPDVPLVLEDLKTILVEIEAQLDSDVALWQCSVFSREPMGAWFQIVFRPHDRRFHMRPPEIEQGALCELWESRQ